MDRLLNKITETEYNMMNEYRRFYASPNTPTGNRPLMPLKELLGEWSNSKQILYKMFGEELILTKEIEFSRSEAEMRKEMNKIFTHFHKFGREEREGGTFADAYDNWIEDTFPYFTIMWYSDEDELTEEQKKINEKNFPIREGLHDLMARDVLVSNVFDRDSFTIPLPNGKEYTINRGCKPMRALAKIANAYDIKGFEDFRICHSLIHNNKYLKGKLSISIHPFDYWTMSDNDCGWESCMNWPETGAYRHGTVEMMNSPCVIVAYLSAEEDMIISGDDKWNNKKWRQLFIVDENCIMGIKAYPYQHIELTDTVIKWLRELAEERLGWSYFNEEPITYSNEVPIENPITNSKFNFTFISIYMYNDIYTCKDHRMFVGTYVEDDKKIYFSGASQCMFCGEVGADIETESMLCCAECDYMIRCAECGEIITGDEYHCHDLSLCEYCFYEYTTTCEFCEEHEFDSEIIPVKLLARASITPNGSLTAYEFEEDIRLCPCCFSSEEIKKIFKPDKGFMNFKYEDRSPYWREFKAICIEDLSDYGLDKFGLHYIDTNLAKELPRRFNTIYMSWFEELI